MEQVTDSTLRHILIILVYLVLQTYVLNYFYGFGVSGATGWSTLWVNSYNFGIPIAEGFWFKLFFYNFSVSNVADYNLHCKMFL